MKQFLAVADPKGLGVVRYKDLINFMVRERLEPLHHPAKLFNEDDDVAGRLKKNRLQYEEQVPLLGDASLTESSMEYSGSVLLPDRSQH